jgi:hypothetical protein
MRRFVLEEGGDLPEPFRNYTVKLLPVLHTFCAQFIVYRGNERIATCQLLLSKEAFQTILPIIKRHFRSPSGTLPKFVSEALSGTNDVPWLVVWHDIDGPPLPPDEVALVEELEVSLGYALLDEVEAYRREEY